MKKKRREKPTTKARKLESTKNGKGVSCELLAES
jgi:hypothetical protein